MEPHTRPVVHFFSNASWLSPGRSTRSVACCIEPVNTRPSHTTKMTSSSYMARTTTRNKVDIGPKTPRQTFLALACLHFGAWLVSCRFMLVPSLSSRSSKNMQLQDKTCCDPQLQGVIWQCHLLMTFGSYKRTTNNEPTWVQLNAKRHQ